MEMAMFVSLDQLDLSRAGEVDDGDYVAGAERDSDYSPFYMPFVEVVWADTKQTFLTKFPNFSLFPLLCLLDYQCSRSIYECRLQYVAVMYV